MTLDRILGILPYLVAGLFLLGAGFALNMQDEYSPDRYYVKVRNGDGCVVVRADFKDALGLAPLYLDLDCSFDMSKVKKGDLPNL